MPDLRVSGKHFKLRLVLTLLFLAIAVAGFTIGITSIGYKEEGFYTLSASSSETSGDYSQGYTATLYFSGKSKEIKNKLSEAEQIYASSLEHTYMIYDDVVEHTGYSSLSVINDNINKDLDVSQELYTLLEDLLAKSTVSNNYSIYADPLYDYWDGLYSLTANDKESSDPKNNLDAKTRLETIVSYINDENHVKLNLLGNNRVHLHVSEDYVSFRRDNNMSTSYISMNVLKEAYRLEDLANKLTEAGYTTGYITTKDGALVSLKDHENPVYVLYDREEEQTIRYAAAQFTSPSSATSLRRFASGDVSLDYVPYYKLSDGTIRNSVLNVRTGYGDETYVSSTLFVKSLNVIDTCLNSYNLSVKSGEDIKGYLSGLNEEAYYIYTKNDGSKIAYVSENLASYVSVNQSAGYELVTF